MLLAGRSHSRTTGACGNGWRRYHGDVSMSRRVAAQAKKEKKPAGKQGGGALAGLLKKKQEAEEQAALALESGPGLDRARSDQYADPELRMLVFLVTQSYWKATKKYLMEDIDFETLPEAIFRAPFALLVHNRFQEGVQDPLFVYANKAALTLFEGTWDTLIGMPSSKAAPDDPNDQQARNALINAAADNGLRTNGEGWRVSLTGKRFKIKGVTVFNVLTMDGEKIGQAAVFNKYELPDGTACETTGEDPPPPAPRVSAEDLLAAESAAEAHTQYVRSLKEQYGLNNKDPRVIEAVANMKLQREQLAVLQQWAAAQAAEVDRLFDEEEAREASEAS